MMPPFVVFPTNRIAHFVEVSLYLFYLAQRVSLTKKHLSANINFTIFSHSRQNSSRFQRFQHIQYI